MPVDERPTIAAPDDDPYVWLEEIDGVCALAWVDTQNAATLARFGSAGPPAHRTFAAQALAVAHHEAVSVGGARVAYLQVGPGGTTGDAPVHLSGYVGCASAQLPCCNSAIGRRWLESGGTSVTAAIGRGEPWTRWHDIGGRAGERRSHDHFAAVAADLVRRGVTRPDRIVAEGRASDGILIANMLTRYPARFGALFCTVPLIDMRRYNKLLPGGVGIGDHGDPDDPDDWAFLQTYSAYHLARARCRYPPIMLAASRSGDGIHPGHARKMVAKLQAMGHEAYFYEQGPAGGRGHAGGDHDGAAFTELGYLFLRQRIGWPANGSERCPAGAGGRGLGAPRIYP
jgi:prolyl oligopeptidase